MLTFQSADGPIVVAAIDFGTTYSGWAFSFKHEFESDPTKISSKHWRGGQLISHKGPTCVLIKPDGKTLDSFAFDAETKYADLSANGDHTEWYYFRRFKMMLYDRTVRRSFFPQNFLLNTMLLKNYSKIILLNHNLFLNVQLNLI